MCNFILLSIVWVRSFTKMFPSVKFAEVKVLVFVILRELEVCSRRHREASEGRSVAPRWPRRTAILQRSAGGVLSLPMRIWSIHMQRGRPGGRFHSQLGSRGLASDRCDVAVPCALGPLRQVWRYGRRRRCGDEIWCLKLTKGWWLRRSGRSEQTGAIWPEEVASGTSCGMPPGLVGQRQAQSTTRRYTNPRLPYFSLPGGIACI